MSSGTSIISAIIANICWTSFISSSSIVKNFGISNDILLADIVMLIVPLEKSLSDEKKTDHNLLHLLLGYLWTLYPQRTGAEIDKRVVTGVEGVSPLSYSHYH